MAFYQIGDAEVRIGYEVTPGTSPANGYLINAKNFGINATRDSAVRPLLNANAVAGKASLGGRDASGTIEIPIQPSMFGVFLYARHGAPVTTGAVDFEHTFTPVVGAQTSLTIEVKLATGEYIRATGCKIGNYTINPTAGATNLTAVFDITGFDADGTQSTSFLTGTETDLTGEADYLESFNASNTGGSAFTAFAWSFSEERPLSARQTLNGSPNASVIFEGKYQPNGVISMFGETTDTQALLTKARAGTADNLTLTLADGATKGLDIVMPTITWVEALPSVDAETVESEVEMNFNTDTSYTVVLRNQTATYPIP
jgi:hypothetical protein